MRAVNILKNQTPFILHDLKGKSTAEQNNTIENE